MNLYVTVDKIAEKSGGGLVTYHESEALKSLGPCDVWDRSTLNCIGEEPWKWDVTAHRRVLAASEPFQLAHFYSGTFSSTINKLKNNGCKVTYMAAAHDINASRKAHEELGIPYNYPHLTDPNLWKRYVAGYLAADVVICPSRHSEQVMRSYGCKNVVVIPHGCTLPETVAPLPGRFVAGYLGSYGADKSVIDLLKAWKKLNYRDATLILAGRDSTSPFVQSLVTQFGGGSIILAGWVDDVADFYAGISLLCQPSRSEGFGLEVLEALAHGRPVVCSDGAGAADVVTSEVGRVFPAGDVDALAAAIHVYRTGALLESRSHCAGVASQYTWDKIRQRYVNLWRGINCRF